MSAQGPGSDMSDFTCTDGSTSMNTIDNPRATFTSHNYIKNMIDPCKDVDNLMYGTVNRVSTNSTW